MPNRQLLAAVDLGSNSFHLVVARNEDGHLVFVDRLRETVRMAAGLDGDNRLTAEAEQRTLDCLARFGQRLRDIPARNVRAVGTNTLRKMRNSASFLAQAREALGHGIDIISGQEEARLIYLGVAHAQAPVQGNQLVTDIGGGSTEVIIGRGFEPLRMESLYMGCVSYSQRYFPNGAITKDGLRRAETAARLELRPVARQYREIGWEIALGASGTIKAIGRIHAEMGWSDGEITRQGLKSLREALLEARHVDEVKLDGLTDDRRPVLAGGLIVLQAVFKSLKLETMQVSTGALREGLLYDLVGRTGQEDVRELSVDQLLQRHRVDRVHAERVEHTAATLFEQVATPWSLENHDYAAMLRWAARLHEIGLAVAHAQYHRHGGYLLRYSDLPGFTQHEQRLLATLVRTHRRKLNPDLFADLPPQHREAALRLAVLLRVAVLLHRSRSGEPLGEFTASTKGDRLELRFTGDYLDEHPLSRADLEQEGGHLKSAGIKLTFSQEQEPGAEQPAAGTRA